MDRLARLSVAHPLATTMAIVLVTLLLGSGLLRLRSDAGFRAYVGDAHPEVQRLDRFLESFGGGLPVAAVWSCEQSPACETIFDPSALDMAAAVSAELARVDGVLAVESPATSPLLVADGDGFTVRRLVENGRAVADRAELARRAVRDPGWIGTLVSRDGRVGALWIELASSGSDVNVRAVRALEAALEPYRAARSGAGEAGGFRFHLVGAPVEFVVAGRELQRDSFRLVPAIALLVGGITGWLFRSARVAVACLGCVGLAVVWSFGAMGWLGWPQTAVGQALAPFILVVGVCDAVHLVGRHAAEVASVPLAGAGPSARRSCVLRAAAEVGPACAMTSLTTAAGFLSFATSGAQSFARFGIIAALGVLAALVISFSLLPICLERIDLTRAAHRRRDAAWRAALTRVADVAAYRWRPVLGIALGLLALSLAGVVRLEADVDPEHLFGERSEVVRWIRFVENNLRDADTVEVALRLPAGQRLSQPESMAALLRIQEAVAAGPGVGPARSAADILLQTRRALHGDDPAFARPGDERANAELVWLSRLKDPRLLDRWLSLDERSLRISVPAVDASSRRHGQLMAALRERIEAELPEGWSYELTGPVPAGFHMVQEVHRTQLLSFATAGVVVFALLAFHLRSVGWGLLGMLPSLLPVTACLGAMGLWEVPLDMGTAMVGAVVVGIAVDDTIHLLGPIRRSLREGRALERAVRDAVCQVGRALVTTSLALAAGFTVLTCSSWQSVASFGLLCAVSILLALVADLVALPALLAAWFGRQRLARGAERARASASPSASPPT